MILKKESRWLRIEKVSLVSSTKERKRRYADTAEKLETRSNSPSVIQSDVLRTYSDPRVVAH
jgi:hypothetical protein